jgi:hypothetical protein
MEMNYSVYCVKGKRQLTNGVRGVLLVRPEQKQDALYSKF